MLLSNEFKNEVFSSFDPNPIRACGICGKKPAMVRTMLNPVNGRTVRMFKVRVRGANLVRGQRVKAASVGGFFRFEDRLAGF